jgi:2-polyprenyl-3-methyl-5-hydroxy-6-metoxy-1,4-benzoquinol methylase
MNRRQKILENLDLGKSVGAEIGPLCSPIVTREEGRVFYVDYTSTNSLRAKYASDSSVDVQKIVEVDAIWGDKSLKEALCDDIVLDYVIASHVLEHVPDLVTWLNEVRSVLKPDGVLRLAIPDRRFTFDYVRGETRLSDILTAYLVRARVPQPREVLDFVLNAKKVDVQKAWSGQIDVAELVPYNTFEDAMRLARDVLENRTYHDTHCWVFTPHSFSGLCEGLAMVGLLPFACEGFHDTEHNQLEFFVKLRPCDDREEIVKSWRQMKASVRDDMTDSMQAELQTGREALMSELAGNREKIGMLAFQLGEASSSLCRRSDSLEVAQRRIASLENSLSWRLTTPLRFVDRALRRLTRTFSHDRLFDFGIDFFRKL